jgi:tetratricopeptide (TPR) repeat protein
LKEQDEVDFHSPAFHPSLALMKSSLSKSFILVCLVALAATRSIEAETNSVYAFTNADAVVNGYLQIQAQLHATQLQIEQSREDAAAEARSNADAMAARIQALEQTIAAQRAAAADAARLTLNFAGMFGLVGLCVLLLMGWFQWRAFSQLAEISSHHGAALAAVQGVHQLAAPGRATVEISNARLLDIVGQLEKKILELESGGRLLAGPAAKSADPLADGQKWLDAGDAQKALGCFEKILSAQPQNGAALVKKAAALDKLGRVHEALAFCDRAIAADVALTSALLQKGGLLNRLSRHEEALKCFEQAMQAQERKAKS